MSPARKKGGLGKGLEALFGDNLAAPVSPDAPAPQTAEAAASSAPQLLPIVDIDPNRYQPRQEFDPEALQELSQSIATHGVLQPVLVTPREGRYMLVAGERRWRAARLAGLTELPALILEMDDKAAAEAALVENLQRSDLNALEEAEGIAHLMSSFSLTQQQAAERLGRSRPAIANSLRLLQLPQELQQWVRDGRLSSGHARCLAGVKDAQQQRILAQWTVERGLSVRQLEELARKPFPSAPRKAAPSGPPSPEFAELEDLLRQMMGTKVEVKGSVEKGKIVLEYYSREDLERLYEMAAQWGQQK